MSGSDITTERSRLIPDEGTNPETTSELHKHDENNDFRKRIGRILLIQFFGMFAYSHLIAPKLRLIELGLCRNFYAIHDTTVIHPVQGWPYFAIDEARCKVNLIQSELSTLRSWGAFLEGTCLLLTAIPFGLLADRWGRSPVFVLGFTGTILSSAWYVFTLNYLPIGKVLVSTVFHVIGGGPSVAMATTITMIADVTPETLRSTAFYWSLSAFYLGILGGNGLAPLTMRIPWLPWAVALLAASISIILAVTARDTRNTTNLSLAVTEQVSAQSGEEIVQNEIDQAESTRPFIKHARNHKLLIIIVLLLPFIGTRVQIPELVMPYVSKRYGWSLGRVSIFDAVSSIIALVFGIFILPGLSRLLQQRVKAPLQANCLVAIYSNIALAISSIVIGLAPTITLMMTGWILWSTGFGARMSVLAIANSLVEQDKLARLNTSLLCIETIADIVFSPLIWRLWSVGLQWGSIWYGLPWFVVAASTLFVGIVLSFIYESLGKTSRD